MNIKNNEIRIGNYITEVGTHFCKVIEIGNTKAVCKFDDSDKYYKINYEQLQPISLTPEWLNKLGFKYVKTRKIYKKAIDIPVYLEIMPKNLHIILKAEGYTNNISIFGNRNLITYVHQLQNLYFSLTQNELTMKTNCKT